LLRLWNVYSFFTIYAEIDGFDPRSASNADSQLTPRSLASSPTYRPVKQRSEIDRWVLSELNQTIATVTSRMDVFDNYNACQAITALVDAVSNWYVRRSRDRFWANQTDAPDKIDAYWTLYETLIEISKLVAPFVPFLAETLWRELTAPFGKRVLASVHLCDYPTPINDRMDQSLSSSMTLLREIASLGRAARAEAKLKVRLPLSRVEVILTSDERIVWLQDHDALVREELNVREVAYTTDGADYVQYVVVPNFKRLGPLVGKRMPAVKDALAKADGNRLLSDLQRQGFVMIALDGGDVKLTGDDIEVRLQAKPGWAAAQGSGCVVVLNTEVTEELKIEGAAKDLIRQIQSRRKTIGCAYTDRIAVGCETSDEELITSIATHAELIKTETLATELVLGPLAGCDAAETDFGKLFVRNLG
jgi:isoleucyl-tRNA synthetase